VKYIHIAQKEDKFGGIYARRTKDTKHLKVELNQIGHVPALPLAEITFVHILDLLRFKYFKLENLVLIYHDFKN
jgi:hypothetical protein